jgi:hypothetical protein
MFVEYMAIRVSPADHKNDEPIEEEEAGDGREVVQVVIIVVDDAAIAIR